MLVLLDGEYYQRAGSIGNFTVDLRISKSKIISVLSMIFDAGLPPKKINFKVTISTKMTKICISGCIPSDSNPSGSNPSGSKSMINCNPLGSKSLIKDNNGSCLCLGYVTGVQCDSCKSEQRDFPNCSPSKFSSNQHRSLFVYSKLKTSNQLGYCNPKKRL